MKPGRLQKSVSNKTISVTPAHLIRTYTDLARIVIVCWSSISCHVVGVAKILLLVDRAYRKNSALGLSRMRVEDPESP